MARLSHFNADNGLILKLQIPVGIEVRVVPLKRKYYPEVRVRSRIHSRYCYADGGVIYLPLAKNR